MGTEGRSSSDKLVLAADRHVKESEYWLNKLSGELVKSRFPYDCFYKMADGQEYPRDMAAETFRFPEPLFAQAMKLSNGVDIKLHMILVTGLFILLSKYTGHKDIMIGAPILKQETEGDFVNTLLVFRNEVDDKIRFKELLLQVRETIINANEHQNYPVEILIDQLNLPIVAGEFPLFDVALLLENLHDKNYLRDVACNMIFSFKRTDQCIEGVVEYHSSLYRKNTIQRIIRHYLYMLAQVLPDVNIQLSRIELLSEEERKQIMADFNHGDVSYPVDKTLHQLFEEQAARTPDNIAAIGPAGRAGTRFIASDRITVTYSELNKKSNQLAHHLRAKGVKTGTIVGILIKRSIEMIIGIFGILKAGGAYLPLDPDYPEERIDFMLKDSGAKVLVSEVSEDVEVIDLIKKIGPIGPIFKELPTHPAHLCYVIYTSGTTGKPRGVLVEHRNVVAYLYAFFREFAIKPGDAVIQLTSYAFDAFVEEVFPLLLRGGRIVIPDELELLDINLLARLMGRHCVNIIDCTPLLLNEFNRLDPGSPEGQNLQSLHTIISGGDVLEEQYVDRLSKIGRVYNTYGPTETTVCATYYLHTGSNISAAIPIGKPVANYNLYILDERHKPVPIGVSGELWVSGAGVTRGYLNHPELTAEKFNRSYRSYRSYISYRTGDLARWLADGNIEFLGRIDQQVKIRGYRIETGEIENQLSKEDGIAESVVVTRQSKDGDKYLCAYIVSDKVFDSSYLRESLASVLPHFMVPAFFVQVEQIPLTRSGKLDMEGLPEPDIMGETEYVAPQNPTQERMQRIWQQVLNLESIGIYDNFFSIGGHSLIALKLLSDIHKAFDVKVPLAVVFDTPTIKGLSDYVEGAAEDRFMPIEVVEKKEYYGLSSAQKRLYFLQQMNLDSIAYNVPAVIPLEVEIDKEQLEQAIKKLIQRHESFRTSFLMINGEPVQRVHDNVEFSLDYYEAAGGNVGIRNNFVRPFDLSCQPLLRVGWVKTGRNKHLFLADMHHIISDGVSIGILERDFMAFYMAGDEELPQLRIQYKDFAEWQNREFEKGVMQKQEEYWLQTFKNPVPRLTIPPDYPPGYNPDAEGGRIRFEVDVEVAERIRKFALETDSTSFAFLLAAYNILLSKYTLKEDIVVGTLAAGRRHADLQNIMGMFVNMQPMRNFPETHKTFKEFYLEVKEHFLEALENQDYPFEQLLAKLDLQRESGKNPLVETVFDFQIIDEPLPSENNRDDGVKIVEPKFDLMLITVERKDRITFIFEYRRQLFKEETIQRMGQRYRNILQEVIDNPNLRLSDIRMLDSQGKDRLKQTVSIEKQSVSDSAEGEFDL